MYSKRTDSVEQHLLNMISILSLWFYLDFGGPEVHVIYFRLVEEAENFWR